MFSLGASHEHDLNLNQLHRTCHSLQGRILAKSSMYTLAECEEQVKLKVHIDLNTSTSRLLAVSAGFTNQLPPTDDHHY